MPGMPGMPQPETKIEETEKSTTQLDTPSHEGAEPVKSEVESEALNKPKLHTLESTVSNQMEFPVPQGEIEVEALRKGFYNNNRIRVGKVFKISRFEQIGSWMKCTDPKLEKRRIEFLNEKRRKQSRA